MTQIEIDKILSTKENAPYTVGEIEKYIITRCTHDWKPISNLQLQKMLYFLQLNFIRKFNIFAFDANFEAWQYGPVIDEVYSTYKGYRNAKINRIYQTNINFSQEHKELIDLIIDHLRDMGPWELVELSHVENGPWVKAFKQGVCSVKKIIDDKDIIIHARG